MGTLLSVIIPCYNVGGMLLQAVESVLGQEDCPDIRLPDVEVLVVDDSSTDSETIAALDTVRHQSPQVRVLKNRRKKGVSGARNQGLEEARGEWVAFLDADDVWVPQSLLHRWRFIQENPAATWVAGDYALWYPDGSLVSSGSDDIRHKRGRILSPAFASGKPLHLKQPVREFIDALLVYTQSVIVRKEILVKLGGFDESLPRAEDYEMWLRVAGVADLYFLPQCIFRYRQRQGSLTNDGGPPVSWETVIVFSRALENPLFREHVRQIRNKLASLYLSTTYYYRMQGRWLASVAAAAATVRWQPFARAGWKQLLAALLAL